ncbi:hypothetical protein pipiens_010494 [Culex pipiens pipiens]|uniref:Uncharacterized protein n=2 Tax=Culex pipiens TaxID=7175 RepID=A0ABD1DAL8_CULPP
MNATTELRVIVPDLVPYIYFNGTSLFGPYGILLASFAVWANVTLKITYQQCRSSSNYAKCRLVGPDGYPSISDHHDLNMYPAVVKLNNRDLAISPIRNELCLLAPRGNEPCELYCTNSEDTIIMPFGDSAADGTPCNVGSNDMCIGGLCRRVGCDWVVDSNTTVDKCGVCGGREDSCTVIQGNVTRQVNASGDGYEELLQVPAGARNILVEEMIRSKNYIGIGKANGQEYYLNGNRHIQLPGEYEMAGSLALYERDDEQERVKIPGPISDDIVIAVIVKKKNNNTSIRYEYTLPSKPTPSPHPSPYYWKLADWSLCSATCGGGKQHRESVCHHRGEGIVANALCEQNAHNKRHDRLTRVCNEDPCPANWWVGPWQLCSVTCRKVAGGGADPAGPVRKRSILCVDQAMNAQPDDRCEGQPRPPDHEPCAGRLPLCKGLLDAHILVEDIPPEYDDENNVI